jgi:type III secretion system FlhB-like substrate exporter
MTKTLLHPAEKFCRDVLARYPGAADAVRAFDDMRGGENWPLWCPLPMAAPYAVLTKYAAMSKAPEIMAALGDDALPKATAALAWMRESKIIYRYDDTLRAALSEQALTGEIPPEILWQMPYTIVYIEDPAEIAGRQSIGFFAWSEWDANQKWQELRILYLLADGGGFSVPIPLKNGADVVQSLKLLTESGIAKLPDLFTSPALADLFTAPVLADIGAAMEGITRAVNLVLYLCSDAPDIPGAAELRQRRTRTADGVPKRAAELDVGYRIGKALRDARGRTYDEGGRRHDRTEKSAAYAPRSLAHLQARAAQRRANADPKMAAPDTRKYRRR